MSPRTPEAPPLATVLDTAERRPTLTPPDPEPKRAAEVVALLVGFIGGLVLGGATVALVPEAVSGGGAPAESRLLVPLEKCIGRGIQGGRQP